MSNLPETLGALSRLLSYPDEQTVESAELLYIVLQDDLPEVAKNVSAFGTFVEQHELWEVEEAFTRIFDINPACSLEVGWHLFGEEYARGMFLVRMREELRKYDLPESVELPDHISHVLSVVAAMPPSEADRFVTACVLPAIEKMSQALSNQKTPYRHVVACLVSVLEHHWGKGSESHEPPVVDRSQFPQNDPLHAFPVAGLACGCESACDSHVDIVPLQMNFSATSEQTEPLTPTPARKP